MPGPEPCVKRKGRWARRAAQPEPKLPLVPRPPAIDRRRLGNTLVFGKRGTIVLEKTWVARQRSLCFPCRAWAVASGVVSFVESEWGRRLEAVSGCL